MRSRIAKRLPPDADKLVGLSLALFASGSRTEDRFWEAKLDALLARIVRNGNQTTLDAALDHLQQNHPDAYGALADMAETHSESFVLEHQGQPYEALLVAAPVLAWTRYVIPSGPLKTDAADALRAHLQAHVLANGTHVAMAPYLYSIDQLPRHHVETWRLAQQLAQAALGGGNAKISTGELPETSPILADPRFLLAVVAAPTGAPLFRWQEEEHGARIERGQCLRVEAFGEGFEAGIERARRVALHAFDAQHGFGERFEPARFDQRFTGQAEQPVEVVGAHAQHAFGVAGAVEVGRCVG